ncbi:MAG: hypothetical protein IKM31_01235 [Oscillospiraceae bacterium]|nr:hypothetical protein [Oscillospiraceae bacterium]
MGVASLVLGIISTFFSCFGGTIFSALIGVIGIALGIAGKKNGAQCAPAGLTLSVIGTVISLVWIAVIVIKALLGALAWGILSW